jgi:glycine cleavage system aminomethyltransferase T
MHGRLGAVFARRGAWEVPATYGGEDHEVDTLRRALGFADVSAQGKLRLSGAIEPLLRRLIGEALDPLLTASFGERDVAARIARDHAVVLTPASRESEVLQTLDTEPDDGCLATDVTSAMSGFLVAGPRLGEFLARTMTLDPVELKAGRCAAASWARIPAILLGSDLEGPAVELYVGSEHGRYAWTVLTDLGGGLGGAPAGWAAIESLGWRRR